MDERTPLFNKSSTTINDGGALPKYISDPRIKGKQRFKWAVPSQETEEAHKDRFFSIRLCYLSMFLSSVSFTISISSMWPYLLLIDKTTDTSFFGWVVSAYSIGQLLSSPFFGWWANKIKYHKLPIIVCLIIMAIGNVVYLYLESFGQVTKTISPKVWMLIARFIMGLGAACAAVIRSYCSSATNLEERTPTLSNISACQGIGFILGPVLQAAFVPIGFPGPVNDPAFHFNMYTSPALLSIFIYIGLAFMTAFYFNEYVVLDNATQNDAAKIVETTKSENDSYTETLRNLPPPDYKAVYLTLLLFFINCFVFSFFETLASPLTIDMYAWSKSQATLYNGIILGVVGVLSVIVVLVGKMLAKKYKEKLLMLVGYIVILISVIGLLPWGNEFPSVQIPTIQPGNRNTTTSMNSTTTLTTLTTLTTDEAPRGCPLDYEWCLYTPIVKLWQFLLGFTLLVIGYSIANVMSFAIYSKILGPKPQGLWMGILTSFGSLSRAVGPVVVAYLYGLYGPRVAFGFLAGVVILATLIIVLTFKRYEAYKFS